MQLVVVMKMGAYNHGVLIWMGVYYLNCTGHVLCRACAMQGMCYAQIEASMVTGKVGGFQYTTVDYNSLTI